MSLSDKHFYDFDRFRIDVAERVLLKDGEVVPLTQKAFDVLLVLVERPGQIVEKEELMQQVWPDTFVEEGNLAQNVYTLRKILGQTIDGQEFIKTVPKRGYRFAPAVTEFREQGPEVEFRTEFAPVVPESVVGTANGEPVTRASVVLPFPKDRREVVPAKPSSWIGQHKNWVLIGGVILLLGFLGSLTWLAKSSGWRLLPAEDEQKITLTNLTTTGNVACAAVSADGKYVVYGLTEPAQRASLWVMQLETLTTQQILPSAEIQYHAVAFTPDGQFIYYVAKENDAPRRLYRVSALGGPTKKLIEDVQTAISFSPDGKRLAFRRASDTRRQAVLFIANADGSGEREIAATNYPEMIGDPAWSPDGKMIACAAGHVEGDTSMYVMAVRVDDGAIKPITAQRFRWVGQLAWLPDAGGLVLIGRRTQVEINQVWRLDYATGEARRVTSDSNHYNRLSLSADGKTLVATQTKQVTNMWMVPRTAPERAEQITFGAGGYRGRLAWTPEGKIVYDSEVGNAATISVMNADGSGQKQLLGEQVNKAYAGHVHASPDGRYLVFASDVGGGRHIWRMNSDGGNLAQLTNGEGEDSPHCSPDSRWVFYTKLERGGTGRPTIWRVAIDGGTPIQLTDEFTAYPAVSPDGKMFACAHSMPTQPWRLAIYPIEGGKPLKIFPQSIQGVPLIRWTPDSRFLTYDENPIGPAKLWLQAVEGGQPTVLAEFVSDRIFGFDWSPDGTRLACVRGFWAANMVLLKDFQ